jgi:F-type H+-transporting ATPase subunit delta
MIQNRAAIRYAKAILAFALEQKAEQEVQKDFQQLLETVNGSPELADFIESPVLDAATKKTTLEKLFPQQSKATQQAMVLLADNQRIDLLAPIAQEYQDRYDALQGIQKAMVTTAVALEASLEKEVLAIAQKMTAKKVVLENRIDPAILGGFILQLGDQQYNASVAQQLQTLKQELTEN